MLPNCAEEPATAMGKCSLCGQPAQWVNPINNLEFCDTCRPPDVAAKAAAFLGRFVAYPATPPMWLTLSGSSTAI